MKYRWVSLVMGAFLVGHFGVACTVESTDGEGDAGEGGEAGEAGEAGSGGEGGDVGEGGAGGEGGGAGAGGSEGGMGGEAGSGGEPSEVELIDCEVRDPEDATVIDAAIDEDQTWSGTVYIDGRIDVRDATVVIEPGTHIIMAVDSDIEFGWNSNPSTVMAEGTPEEPIRICGEQGEAGYWEGILVNGNVTSDSVLQNVLIADAGGIEQALTLNADLTIVNLQVRNSASDGVVALDFAEDSEQLSVEGSEGAAVILTGGEAATRFPLGGVFANNGEDLVRLRYSAIDGVAVFQDVGIPYLQESSVDVRDGAELTYEAGVEVQFAADADLEIGWNSGDVTVQVEGTEDAPVVFSGRSAEAGYWEGIVIQPNVRTDSTLSNLEIRHAGGGGINTLLVRAAIAIDNVLLEDNATGMWIGDQGLDADSTNLSITGTSGIPLTVTPDALVTLPEGGDFTGNQTDHVAVEGGGYNQNGTVPNLGIPYRILADIDTRESSMTISPGTHFVMSPDADIEFGWNSNIATITAEGTEDEPIRFTGLDETAGSWPGLLVGPNVASTSTFDYVEIGHGGDACLTLRRALSVTNSTFFACTGYGILKTAADTSDYTATNTFDDDLGLGPVGDL